MARSFYHLSILVLVSILLRPSPLPSKLFCLLELTQPAEFGGEVMCTAVLWPYRAIFKADLRIQLQKVKWNLGQVNQAYHVSFATAFCCLKIMFLFFI
jgi:hypothetical protein